MEIPKNEIGREFDEVMGRIGQEFASELGFRNARNYLIGLMGKTERKNGWQLSEANRLV